MLVSRREHFMITRRRQALYLVGEAVDVLAGSQDMLLTRHVLSTEEAHDANGHQMTVRHGENIE